MSLKKFINVLLISAGLMPGVASADLDPDHWYVTGSVGVLLNSQLDESNVTLSKTQYPIQTRGNFTVDGDRAFAFTVGRHFERDAQSSDWRKRPLRLEMEY